MIGLIPILEMADARDVDRSVTIGAGLVLCILPRLEVNDFLSR